MATTAKTSARRAAPKKGSAKAVARYELLNGITFRPIAAQANKKMATHFDIEYDGSRLFERPVQFTKPMAFASETDRREIRKVLLANHHIKMALGLACCGGNCCKE